MLAVALLILAGASVAGAQSSHARSAGRRPDTLGVEQLVGCYRFTLGPWSQNTSLGPPSQTEVVRLDTAIATRAVPGSRVAARVAPVDILAPTDPRAKWLQPASWRVIGSDSLEISTWSTGTEGESFHGHVTGAELRGVMRRTSDAIPVDPKTHRVMWDVWPWATATARRVACP